VDELSVKLKELLPGWTIGREMAQAHPAQGLQSLWEDGAGLAISRDGSDLLLRFDNLLSFAINAGDQAIRLRPLGPYPDMPTIEHLLFDQLVPRLRSHLGELVVHAAAVAHQEGVILLLGPSGRGKSTLSASLEHLGCVLLGDDAVVLHCGEHSVAAAALYPSLRLLPDSIMAIFGGEQETRSTAQYTIKRRIDRTASNVAPRQCAALFVLTEPNRRSKSTSVHPLAPAQACIEMIRESFALDPCDTHRAAQRLRLASRAAELIPAFALDYPRDYGSLGEVGRTVLAAAEGIY
jgi:hypothetical protein